MTADLTNLLPPHRKRFLMRDYVFRLSVVALWLLILLVMIHTLLLVPSYLYAHQQIRDHEQQLATLQAAQSTATEQELKGRIAALGTKAKQLTALGKQATASGALRAVLAAPRTGVRVHGITYTPSAKPEEHKMALHGVASTRESLQQYLAALDALPFVAKAELPISAYAKERDIGFTITLTGNFMP